VGRVVIGLTVALSTIAAPFATRAAKRSRAPDPAKLVLFFLT